MSLAALHRGISLLSVWDYDAPGLDPRARLQRLRYALQQAYRQCNKSERKAELLFAISDCDALLGMSNLEGGSAEGDRVEQRIARIRRVALHHEGTLARLNRRYWWVPFSVALLVMVVVGFPGILALLEELRPVW